VSTDQHTLSAYLDNAGRDDVLSGGVKRNFYLYGQSWGGALAIEYALTYQQHLKG
jgi:proline iminopeptidase